MNEVQRRNPMRKFAVVYKLLEINIVERTYSLHRFPLPPHRFYKLKDEPEQCSTFRHVNYLHNFVFFLQFPAPWFPVLPHPSFHLGAFDAWTQQSPTSKKSLMITTFLTLLPASAAQRSGASRKNAKCCDWYTQMLQNELDEVLFLPAFHPRATPQHPVEKMTGE